MNTAIAIIPILVSAAAVVAVRVRSSKKRYSNPEYLANLERIDEFFSIIESLDDYLTWVKRDELKSRFADLGKFFRNQTKTYNKEEKVAKFNSIFQDFDAYVANYNSEYVYSQKQKLSSYFDSIEGKKLDGQQRNAVITDEHSNLIIAGAGSGKTLTILAKVQYLIEQKNIAPSDILLLSFTQKTVEELNERLEKLGIATKAATFHKLGYDIIRKYSPSIPAVTNDNTLSLVVKKYFETEIYGDPKALEAYVNYVACYMNIPEENDSYGSLGEKLSVEKGIDFQTLKSKCDGLNMVETAALDTIRGERVKSVEELMIANFLYINGIEYEYEKPYPFGNAMVRPDFYLTDYDIYLEHFGVDENNQAKWLTQHNADKYVEGMEFKREMHKTHGTKLLETYSYYNRDNVLLDKLREMLEAENVAFSPRDSKDIYRKVSANDQNFGKELTKLIESFVNLGKSRRLDKNSLLKLYSDKAKTPNGFMLDRQQMFLKFSLPILARYDEALAEKNEIDFNDMINRATDLVVSNKPNYTFRHIIIDEYQDISHSRFSLIKEIRDLCGARLVCVGDDWQSIYRFAGSDVSLFSSFGKYVGKYEQLLIEQTYRNSQSLVDIASGFVQKNPNQIRKAPKSGKPNLMDPVKFVKYREDEIQDVFINQVQRLSEQYGNKSILVLGRHGFDINSLVKQPSRIRYIERSGKIEIEGFENLDIKFLTAHRSKGTEADNVIVLNLKNHLLGFPNKISDDPILSLLLNDQEEFRFAEERRLFYVALTRTRNEAVLLLPPDISLFAEELLSENNLMTMSNGKLSSTNCPYCKTGKLVIRQKQSDGSQFLGCSNYPACNQTFNNLEILENSILCQECKSAYMTKRKGKWGHFLGCENYPRCRNTIKLR